METCLLEICVDSLESAVRAAAAGASRLELCADLPVGGTSPSPFLIKQVLAAVDIPVNVLLRPRFGDFCFTDAEKAVLLEEIDSCRALGAAGVVIGALTPEGELDTAFLARCMARKGGMTATLHRCFDVCRDPAAALEQAVALGFDTILTSGQQAAAPNGTALLRALHTQAAGRIALLAGSGVTAENISEIGAATGIRQFHLSAKRTEPGPMVFRRAGVPMGLPMASEFDRQYADPAAVAAARAALDRLAKGDALSQGENPLFVPYRRLAGPEVCLQLTRTASANPEKLWVDAGYYTITLPDGTPIGTCDLRAGHNENTYYGGNIGYTVDAAYRGHGYAAKACALLLPVAKALGMGHVYITCDPANAPSRRTCEKLGAAFVENAALPPHNDLYRSGARQVLVYRVDL